MNKWNRNSKHYSTTFSPKDKVEDPAVHERQKLQAFLDDKSDNYIPNKAYISYLDKFLNDTPNQHLVITGESGMGKSALLAYWLKKYHRR